MGNKLKLNRTDFFTYIELNRPEKRNAIDYEVIEQLHLILDEVKEKQEDKCLVITGTGEDAFCSGGDLSVFHELYTKEDAYQMLHQMSRVLFKLYALNIPTVALLNGLAIGGGAELATACDFRLAAPQSKIGFVQGKLAITTGWGGASMLMERLRPEEAFEMLLSCQMYSAQQAKELGFVQQVLGNSDVKTEAEKHFSAWRNVPLQVLKAYKQRKLDRTNLSSLKGRIQKEVEECSVLWETDIHHQAVEAFQQRKR
ncbi:enoyl-CoA hydratase/isomerase family protein [Alteribacillus sp. YIM 98480]|uniref:enoyl-CoA hydratase/isomerase family protein n=1 Tax=Alteribacillus sp. YIM 98480 TaxID=2606599 RepID=UPI00131E1FFA|nr:enoyl-CoA hydratase/isomerase family protein [Alteribacillus sp. YIM 98480]